MTTVWLFFLSAYGLGFTIWVVLLKEREKENARILADAVANFEAAKAQTLRDKHAINDLQLELERLLAAAKLVAAPHLKKVKK